jgi:multicomponent Na+:H+ antiporter subunit D
MPFTMFAFLLGSLSIIGLPPLAGTWSKWYLVQAAFDAGLIWVVLVLIASSLLNILYLLPIAARAFFLPLPKSDAAAHHHPEEHAETVTGWHEAPLLCVVPLTITALGCVALFLWPDLFLELAQRVGTD